MCQSPGWIRIGPSCTTPLGAPPALDRCREDVTVEAIETPGEMRELRGAWRELEESVASLNPFLTWDWQWSWWEVFGESHQPHILLVRDGDELVGLVPLCDTLDQPGHLLFGGGINLSDRLGFLHKEGEEAAVARAALEWATSRFAAALTLDLHFLPADSTSLGALKAAATELGLSLQVTPEEVCPGLNLAPDFDAYLATQLDKKDRHELRRKFRRLDQERAGWRMVTQEELGVEAALEQFLKLLGASGAHKEAFLVPEVREFFRRIAARLEARGWLRLRLLESQGEFLAGIFGFTLGGSWHLYNSGYDPSFATLSPGLLCVAEGIREAIAEGCSRADLLRGGEPYKYRLGAVDEQLVRLQITPGSSL